jgi:hypothetical protein
MSFTDGRKRIFKFLQVDRTFEDSNCNEGHVLSER